MAHAYERCTPKNSYLEHGLPPLSTQIVTSLPKQCVESAQMQFPAKGVYGFCPSAKGRIKRDRVRPCGSEAYVGTVHAAIADVAECLGANPRLLFVTLNLESGLHVNAVGPAGDAGIGQLTRPAIDEVNRRAFDAAREEVKKSNSPACRKILPHLTKLSSDVANRCAFIRVPDNPTRALIYSVLLIKQNRKAIDLFWDRLKPKISADLDLKHLKQHLTMLSYNAGPAGPVAVTAAFARSLGGKLTNRDLNFSNTGPRGIVQFISKHFPVAKKQLKARGRIGHYVPAIIAANRRVEEKAGVACVEPDTFPSLERSFAPDQAANESEPAPDDQDADKDVEENMKTLAESFAPEVRGFGCADAQAEFLTQFLPAGGEVEDLPDYLRPAYDALCGR